MDEVIGMTNGYGCGKRRKSGTVGYLLNQSSDEPSITTTGGEAKLRRLQTFLSLLDSGASLIALSLRLTPSPFGRAFLFSLPPT